MFRFLLQCRKPLMLFLIWNELNSVITSLFCVVSDYAGTFSFCFLWLKYKSAHRVPSYCPTGSKKQKTEKKKTAFLKKHSKSYLKCLFQITSKKIILFVINVSISGISNMIIFKSNVVHTLHTPIFPFLQMVQCVFP